MTLDELLERARALQPQPTNRAPERDTSRDWCRIVNKDDDAADVFIYDEIGFWGTTAADFSDQLRDIKSSTINLHINSPGGSVFDGVAIYNALKDHSATVNVTVDALAASAASFIAQAGDTIRMGRQAMMMIHDASGLTIGNAADMREMADLLDKLSNAIAEIYADRSGFPSAHWRNAMLAETWYSAQEAVDAMLADETTRDDDEDDEQAKLEKAASQLAARFDLTVFNYPGRKAAPAPELVAKARREDPPPDPDDPPAAAPPPEELPAAAKVDDPEPVDEPVDMAALMRGAFEEAAKPPPFEFSPEIFRSVVTERVNNAPAVTLPTVPTAADDDDVAVVPPDPDDASGSLSSDDGPPGFGDVFRAAVDHRAKNAPAVDLPRFPDDPAPSDEPLDMGRIILEAAIP